jgi:hypothetical protein
MKPTPADFTRLIVRLAVPAACALIVSGCCNIQGIRTESLPDAAVGQPYSFSLEHNCTGKSAWEAEDWRIVTGTSLPPGISLSRDGRFSGAPTTAGLSTFSVQLGSSSTAEFTIRDVRSFSLVVR